MKKNELGKACTYHMVKKRDNKANLLYASESHAQRNDLNTDVIRQLRLANKRGLAAHLLAQRNTIDLPKQRQVPFYLQEYDEKLYQLCIKEMQKKSFSCKL